MKYCPRCGAAVEEGSKFCVTCGEPLTGNAAPAEGFSDVPAPVYAPKAATKKEFLDLPENSKMKKEINSSAIISYICAGITLLVAIVAKSPLSFVDVVILVVLGLLIHLKQSRACAIILLIYAIINVIVTVVTTQSFGGYLIVIAGIFAVIYTFKLDKAWKEYQAQ